MPMATPEAQREYQRQWRAARRAAYFEGKSCARCGSKEDLTLDHIDPRTKVEHNIWSWAQARRDAELVKCQVLCRPCHVKKSIEQMPLTNGFIPYRHGTCSMYDRGCRCGLCKLWKRHTNAKRAERGWGWGHKKTLTSTDSAL